MEIRLERKTVQYCVNTKRIRESAPRLGQRVNVDQFGKEGGHSAGSGLREVKRGCTADARNRNRVEHGDLTVLCCDQWLHVDHKGNQSNIGAG